MARTHAFRLLATLALLAVVVIVLVYQSFREQPRANSSYHQIKTGKGAPPPQSPCPLPGAGLFSYTHLPSTALVSFPGSGNTWTRHLLTTATGLVTASVSSSYMDIPIADFRERAHHVIVIKSHYTFQKTQATFHVDRSILLIRNPYDALLAQFNLKARPEDRVEGRGSLAIRPPKDFLQEWPKYVNGIKAQWGSLYLSWASSSVPVHVMVYSRMTSPGGLEKQLRHTFHFLNHTGITSNLPCVLQNTEGRAHRQKAAWQKEAAVYSQDQVRYLNTAIDQVCAALEKKTGENFQDILAWKR